MIAVGDGALGFWAALRDTWPETREQRDWVHKVANVLDALPKSVQPTAKKMLDEIRNAEDRATPSLPRSGLTPSSERSGPKPPTRSTANSTGC